MMFITDFMPTLNVGFSKPNISVEVANIPRPIPIDIDLAPATFGYL